MEQMCDCFAEKKYGVFKCIGSNCIDNCCHSWSISVSNETVEYYRAMKGTSFVENHLTKSESGIRSIKLCEDGKCIFQNETGLCKLFLEFGQKGFSPVCLSYPRKFLWYGDVLNASLMLSCPHWARQILLCKDGIEFANFSMLADSSTEGHNPGNP